MKKFFLTVALCTLIGACQQISTVRTKAYQPVPSHSLIKISWEQEGKNCMYKESFGEVREEWNSEKKHFENKEYVSSVKTIKYGNTACEKVIDSELKNRTNKSAISNQFH